MTKSVYVHSSPVPFLQSARASYGERKKPIALSVWARKLGYKSSRTLEMVLSGRRLPSEDLIFKIAKDLKLSERETLYFQLLVQREKKLRQKKAVHEIEQEMDRIRPARYEALYISNEVFHRVSEWYPIVIRQLAMTPGFQKDIRWIFKKLRGKASDSQIAAALAEWDALALDRRALYTAEDVPSRAVRMFHKKMLHRAIESIEDFPVDQREMISITFRSSPKNIGFIKKTLRDVRDHLSKELEDVKGTDVFQLTLAFFPHTHLDSQKEN